MQFKTRYNCRKPSAGIVFKEPSLTRQSEFEETTIDYYLKRYSQTGVLGDPTRFERAQFGDFSDIGDFADMQEKVLRVNSYFNELPAEIRAQFGNDSRAFAEFVADPANADKCVDLGIFEAPAAPSAVEQTPPVAEKQQAEVASGDSAS